MPIEMYVCYINIIVNICYLHMRVHVCYKPVEVYVFYVIYIYNCIYTWVYGCYIEYYILYTIKSSACVNRLVKTTQLKLIE